MPTRGTCTICKRRFTSKTRNATVCRQCRLSAPHTGVCCYNGKTGFCNNPIHDHTLNLCAKHTRKAHKILKIPT